MSDRSTKSPLCKCTWECSQDGYLWTCVECFGTWDGAALVPPGHEHIQACCCPNCLTAWRDIDVQDALGGLQEEECRDGFYLPPEETEQPFGGSRREAVVAPKRKERGAPKVPGNKRRA